MDDKTRLAHEKVESSVKEKVKELSQQIDKAVQDFALDPQALYELFLSKPNSTNTAIKTLSSSMRKEKALYKLQVLRNGKTKVITFAKASMR